ncbi:hypothetical protein GCM10010228_70240 [Streptomyces massasporeus]|nr:hypothetical protein [Streptomyces massasporeus]GGV87616.1 hypothetical protein GCM10010228_70240 [Streptomyces massasporeus]
MFVLHDVFAVPFSEIGTILGKPADATKMPASRARRKIRDARQPASTGRQQREVAQAFLAAARDGRFEELLRVLHPDVKLTAPRPACSSRSGPPRSQPARAWPAARHEDEP